MSKESHEAPPKVPEIYFELRSSNFLMELIAGRFLPLSGGQAKNQLQLLGHHTELKNDFGLSWGDEILAQAQVKNYVDYAGPLAGYKAGLYTMAGGTRVLVTTSCNPVMPGKNKRMPFLKKFISELLEDQEIIFYAWLKLRLESLWKACFTPSQLLALCGPPGCGKTFLQWIITQMLGGRAGKPYAFMTGKTDFNEDIAQAEHLVMGDEESSRDIRSRIKFAAKIKQLCVEPDLWIQGKGKKAVTLETRRALSIGVNHEPEHMLVIPPLDSDMVGKISLLRCHPAELSLDRLKNQNAAKEEFPALACFLRDLQIPKDWRDSRFGVKAYHHPELLEMVSESSPENQMLSILDEVLFSKSDAFDCVWRGSAETLKVELLGSEHHSTVNRLLDWPAACGTYLARLKQKLPDRFERRTTHGKSVWIIKSVNEKEK